MTDLRVRLAEAIAEAYGTEVQREDFRAADKVLALPGIAIVELPEADANGEFEGGRVWINPLTGFVRFLTAQFQPKEARSVAAALLAAAGTAEREST